MAHVNNATHRKGMVRILAMKSQRSFGGLIYRNGRDTVQKMAKLSKAGAVISALGGKAFSCQVAKEGQIASIMACTAWPPT